ncbi:hypothetical protein LQW54_004623 [Pestalotiopsis sp. IQ-011]
MAPGTVVHDDLEDYGMDDFGGDPFAESGDDNANKADSQSKKRKDASGLGIDEAIAVSKKARVPRVKLDDKKLLSDKGIPKLRKKAGDLKFKGKGHELWLDDLYPKAKFLDALGMVEKAGHTRAMRLARMDWINEGKPKSSTYEDDGDDADLQGLDTGREPAKLPARIAPIFEKSSSRPNERPKTPSIDDLFGDDDDMYDATPKASRKENAGTTSNSAAAAEPDDEEDLDALMAEEEASRQAPTSIFGNGRLPKRSAPRPSDPDEDDLDALMAEAEATTTANERPKPAPKPQVDEDSDDLDALMAEAEAEGSTSGPKPSKGSEKDKSQTGASAEEEEAMAEMDGLW